MPQPADQPVKTGLDLIQREGFARLAGQRVGLLVHPAAVDRRLAHAAAIFHAAGEVDLRCLFGPQHGLHGETQDNMIEWEGFTDPVTGLRVLSLYGRNRRPTGEQLAGIDTLVIDLQDVGTRCYTFIWTVLLCLEACAEAGKRVLVLDRPNPIGGSEREGAILDPEFSSFVGLAPIPLRHGLTIGELALYFRRRFALDVQLEVVRMEGWRRALWFEQTGLPWVMPSPNMPTVETALVYPGMCLLEGTELSEGRGTTRPFEIFGAPFIDPERLVARLQAFRLPGAVFRPLHFEPTFQKHASRVCGGAQIHVTDRHWFRPVLTAVSILAVIRELWPDDLQWKQPPYEYETEKLPLDILAGGAWLREGIEAAREPGQMAAGWQVGLDGFAREIGELLRYE